MDSSQYDPSVKITSYINLTRPTKDPEMFVHCLNIGSDGRSLDEILTESVYIDPMTGDQQKFKQYAKQISRIFVKNFGHVIVDENGLELCTNLKDLDIGINDNLYFYTLHISPSEYLNTPRLRSLSLRSIDLSEDAIIALIYLKDRLEYLRIRNVTPIAQLLDIISQFTKLRHVYLRGMPKDIEFPTSLFNASAQNLTWITVEECNLPLVPVHMFKNMKNLIKLELFRCKITTIEPGAFDELTDLKELSLAYNDIKELPLDLFKNTVNLTHVYLALNCIENITRDQFSQCKNLVRFEI